jgi:hypothetical protein
MYECRGIFKCYRQTDFIVNCIKYLSSSTKQGAIVGNFLELWAIAPKTIWSHWVAFGDIKVYEQFYVLNNYQYFVHFGRSLQNFLATLGGKDPYF